MHLRKSGGARILGAGSSRRSPTAFAWSWAWGGGTAGPHAKNPQD